MQLIAILELDSYSSEWSADDLGQIMYEAVQDDLAEMQVVDDHGNIVRSW